ncbi:MAG: glycosyltransferase [Geminicoccaceae bacterium]
MPASPLVTALIATRRPAFVPEILAMMRAQDHRPVEIVLVLHGIDPPPRVEAADKVMSAPAAWSLGECLNAGIAESSGDIIAKIDDDDIYTPGYLSEAVTQLATGRAGVVGKAEHLIYYVPSRELHLWHPGASHHEQHYLPGGTLVFGRRLGLSPGFPPLSLGEDNVFCESCRAQGEILWSTSRRNHVVRRFADEHHTSLRKSYMLAERAILLQRDVDPDVSALLKIAAGG